MSVLESGQSAPNLDTSGSTATETPGRHARPVRIAPSTTASDERSSPDPMSQTDRYRLVMPYLERI
jgi:hypothetical protein